MKRDDCRSLSVGHPLRHRYTGERATLTGVTDSGVLLIRFDGDAGGEQTMPAEFMADATLPPPKVRATEADAGYTVCVRCDDVYDVSPGDLVDNCPGCGPVTWEPEVSAGATGGPTLCIVP